MRVTSASSSIRALSALSAGLLALGMLAGCTPQPDPSPTPSKTALFSSDAEAFKAAEETYRAYTDADNAQRRGEQDDPQDYLIGDALEGYISGQRALHDAGLTLEGDVLLASFTGDPQSVEQDRRSLSAMVCLDLSKSTARSSSGDPIPDRPPVAAQKVEMKWVEGSYRISGEYEADNSACGG